MRYLGQNYSHRHLRSRSTDGRGRSRDELARDATDASQAEHRRLYGYDIPDEIVELVTFKVDCGRRHREAARSRPCSSAASRSSPKASATSTSASGGWMPTAIYDRDAMPAGTTLQGPAIVEERMSTTLIHPGQSLEVDTYGNLILWPRGRQA